MLDEQKIEERLMVEDDLFQGLGDLQGELVEVSRRELLKARTP